MKSNLVGTEFSKAWKYRSMEMIQLDSLSQAILIFADTIKYYVF
jgi:hypothetical protein